MRTRWDVFWQLQAMIINILPDQNSRRAALALLFNTLIWGTSWWPFRYLQLQGIHPLWSTWIISGVAFGFSILYYRPAWREFYSQPGLWVLCAAAGLTNICFNWAISTGDVLRVILLFYFMPAWSVLLGWWLLHEKPNMRSAVQLLLALTGTLLVLKTPDSPWPVPQQWTDWLGLLGGFFFALNNTMLRRLRTISSAARMQAMFSGGLITSSILIGLGLHWALLQPLPAWDWHWVLFALVFSVLVLMSNLSLQYGAARLLARTTALIMLSEVVFAALSSVLTGVSELRPLVVLGGGLIVGGVLWSITDSRSQSTHQHS